ncbi:methylenetetrahydrofolate--tRNA-(uracil(54)-C(5))-methyltransferase (FADH(2)-oxidizing) TrmFO [Natranaerofaba carboxydovora]|uniref:methylenetetrahydrofolate--tRNA-(uracil(54)- C(5))-methyltransferase (FADH(2)-oxidizing) TrmFO n=1 Tax=Natranaerofaba carboxydovora TaxID=2742683 RepID=UPI001F13F6B8|nr:methylenetetrahydrofolate--tRNA-(uracil(54)-C(5))-methyltransferase (FADH(2)-oxidizing) TrmFO [Natranaerofaba carboxydovora]UMZ73348.1 Methylenetetrahydrofolate--tRNA-(uracil-5-)-methyltransferase TrmFO [Natranaerofaba carboxydovora]
MSDLVVVGGGLAGVEAAWQAANRGIKVDLYEMRPEKMTPAHKTSNLAELVCSNSLRASSLENAAGLLKEEMKKLGSLIMKIAERHQVPAGGAMAVDRERFAKDITETIENHENINLKREEFKNLDAEKPTIIATGPLTSQKLVNEILNFTDSKLLYFYDAAAPIVTYESINHNKVFRASRYDKGTADYLNCPMTKEEYKRFYQELINGDVVQMKDFEKQIHFEGCMPVEVMAKRGAETLTFGPLKPVGLKDPRTGEVPYAVAQLRQDDKEGNLYNLVGFQTQLKWPEQKRIFRLIPGLENAEFVRYGVMHRNTYVNSPSILKATYQLKDYPNIFLAGQITGVEGYIESASSGIVAGINASRLLIEEETLTFPEETAHGALSNYITTASPRNFQPMNINFGLLPPPEDKNKKKVPKKEKKAKQSEKALSSLENFINENSLRLA